MRHEEDVRELLPLYAAGQLDDARAWRVRAHIADGCLDCLRIVFGTPLPEPAPAAAPGAPVAPVVMVGPVPPPRRRGWGTRFLAAVVLGAVAAGAVFAWRTITDLRARAATQRAEAERQRADAERQRAEAQRLAADVERRERERENLAQALADSRAEEVRQSEAARAASEETDELRRALEESDDRIGTLARRLRQRDATIERLAVDSAVREVIATPGARLLPLGPVAPFREGRGHVLWHPDRDVIVLFAFGLPRGKHYRVDVLGVGSTLASTDLTAVGIGGEAALPLRLAVPAAEVRAVSIVLDPPGREVLAGRSS